MAEGVLVVGGGITGLALAARLAATGADVRLLEAAPRLGGNVTTLAVDAPQGRWLLDLGPNSFGDASAPLMDLVRFAGIEDRLVRAPASAGRRYLFRDGRLREVPSSPLRFLASPLLPIAGRLRLLRELFVPPRAEGPEESLAAFCDRRLGRAAREKLLTPVIGGIYAGDPERLGAESAFPAMVALEREHGSLLAAARRGKGPPSRGVLASFRDGLAELPAALGARLGARAATGAAAARLERRGDGWRVTTADGRAFDAASVVLALPADGAAALVRAFDPPLAGDLDAIPYAPMAVVHVGVRRDALGALPPGFGFLVPRGEGLRILGAIFSSELFPGRAPEGHALLTVFAGGMLDPEAPSLEDAALVDAVTADLGRALDLRGAPAFTRVTRWRRAIPQYVVGHRERAARIAAAAARHAGLCLAGNWTGGIALPDCARAAERIAGELAAGRPTG